RWREWQRHCEFGSPIGGHYLIHNFALPVRRFQFTPWWHFNGLPVPRGEPVTARGTTVTNNWVVAGLSLSRLGVGFGRRVFCLGLSEPGAAASSCFTDSILKGYVMRFTNSSLAMVAALMLGFSGANATAQTYQAPTNQPSTDQAPGAKSDITRVQAGSDTS